MGRIHKNLKRIYEKSKNEGSQEVYQPLLEKFVTLLTYEDTYLMNKKSSFVVLGESGEDVLLSCGDFGIIITPKDEISIHT